MGADETKIPNDQLHALLGDQAFQKYLDYQHTGGAYSFASQLATAMTSANAPPISADQADQLAQIVLNNNPSYQGSGPVTVDLTNWDSAMTQAQRVLSAQQLQVAQDLVLMMKYHTALAMTLRTQDPSGTSAPHVLEGQIQGGRR